MNLYQLSQTMQDKMTQLGEMLLNGETPTAEQENELIDLQGDLQNKLVGYGFVVKNLESEVNALDDEIKRLTARKKARQNQIEMLENRMKMAMIDNDIAKVDDPVMPISIKNNPPSVRLDIDPKNLPARFVKIKYEADKTALSKALKIGDVIDGVSLEVKQRIVIG